jgi:hypothetical protein
VKHYLYIIIASVITFLPLVAFAQVPISVSIPGSYVNGTSSSPGSYVANFYQFALLIGGILALGVVIYGGILYMTTVGNPSGQSEAKAWLWAAVGGILLLGGAYLILNIINPQLLNLNLPGLNNTGQTSNQAPTSGGTSSSSGGGGTCKAPASGPCSVSALSSTCLGNNAAAAAQICNAESSGQPGAGGDKSTSGQPVSIGLFQVNLTANTIAGLNCPAAFDHSWHAPGVCGKGGAPNCGPSTIKTDSASQALYAKCAAAAQDVQTNIQKACALSKNGTNWGAWSTSKTCGL